MSQGRSEGAVVLTWFAAIMLIMVGVFTAIAGLSGILKDNVYGASANLDYVFKMSTTGWGWVHLIWGIVLVLAGFALFGGAVWARTVGVIAAVLSAIANFAFLPLYPIWAITIIILDVAIIWALTAHGRDVTKMGAA